MAVWGSPLLQVEIAGAPLGDGDRGALSSIRVQQRLSLPALCELTFVDPTGTVGVERAPGDSLVVRIRNDVLFKGEVTAIEYSYRPFGAREIRIRGYDPSHRLRKRQPVKAHVDISLRDLATDLVTDLGLSVDGAADGPLVRNVVQDDQTDLDLLSEVADRCGCHWTVRGDVMYLLTLEGTGEPLSLTLGESLLEASIDVNGDPSCRVVVTEAWDPLQVASHSGQASAARTGREVQVEVAPSAFGSDGTRHLAGRVVESVEQAEALAQAELDRRLAREVVLTGVAEGDPRLTPGQRVGLSGVAARVAGTYVLTEVTHTVDAERGYLSAISSEPPQAKLRRGGARAALGVVTRVNDPDNLGRVRVTLPAYAGLETDWLHVTAPAAGADKGLAMLPDVDDHVLVLLADEDRSRGVVLGGLYGRGGIPDSGVSDGAVRRFTLRTAAGHVIQLDDESRSMKLTDATGNCLELTPGHLKLHAAVDLVIEAPGRSLLLRAQKIDFERQ